MNHWMTEVSVNLEEVRREVLAMREAQRSAWLKSQLVLTCTHESGYRLTMRDEYGQETLTDSWWCPDCGAGRTNDSTAWVLPRLIAALKGIGYSA